jgi:hypothetical protein
VQPVLGGKAQELMTVMAGVGRDAAELPFGKQVLLVAQPRNVGQMDAGQR